MPDNMELNILSQDYYGLRKRGKDDSLFHMYDVMGIIGTNPRIPALPCVSLEELISGQAQKKLTRMLSPIATPAQVAQLNDNLVQRFSLERLIGRLTILDVKKVLENIDECLQRLEELTGDHLNNQKRAGIYFHVSCMVERLIRNQDADVEPVEREESHAMSATRQHMLPLVQTAFSDLEQKYNICIPLAEWQYIVDIVIFSMEASD